MSLILAAMIAVAPLTPVKAAPKFSKKECATYTEVAMVKEGYTEEERFIIRAMGFHVLVMEAKPDHYHFLMFSIGSSPTKGSESSVVFDRVFEKIKCPANYSPLFQRRLPL